jgi:uncharacterized protein
MIEGSPLRVYMNGARLFPYINMMRDEVERQKLLVGLNLIWDYCFSRLTRLAMRNDPDVWYALGDAFSHGRGTERDRDEEIRWFQRAAEAGHTHAMVRLGARLRYPECDRSGEAILWFRKAAEKGDTGGMTSLGFAYRDGNGIPANPEKAVEWFVKAAEAGDKRSLMAAGKLYFYALKCPTRALHWLLKAAEAGCSEGYLEIANLYDDRKTSLYNPIAAARWYHVVAERDEWGASAAMLALSRLYRDGVGVWRSPKVSRMWLQRLLSTGKEARPRKKAAKLLQEMESDLL